MQANHRIALYVRVSTEEQAANPEGSIKSQEQRLRQHVQLKNMEHPFGDVTRVFIDRGKSGKDTNRSELQKLLTAVRNKEVTLVLVTEISRLSRSIRDFCQMWELMRACGCDFQSIREQFDTTSAAGEMVLYTLANIAQFERKTVSERVKANFVARAERGLYNGGSVPLGYMLIPDKSGYLEVDEDAAKVVREVFETFIREGCLSKTGKSLNDRGIQLQRHMQGGGNFARHSFFTVDNLHQILTNKAYIGLRVFTKNGEKKTSKACWPGIIDPDVFDRVQNTMKSNWRRLKPTSWRRHDYLLTSKVFCEKCGDKLVGKSANGEGGKFFYYEHSAATKRQAFLTKKFFTCKPGRIKAGILEERVWQEVIRIITQPSIAGKLLEKAKGFHPSQGNVILADKLRLRIRGIEEQIDAMAEHLSKIPKDVSPTPIFNQMKRLEKAKLDSVHELDELLKNSSSLDLPVSLRGYELFLKALRNLMNAPGTNDLKTKIIAKLIHKIEVKADGFKLHYYVGSEQISLNKWELESVELAKTGTAGENLLPTSEVGPRRTADDHFFKIFSSKTLTNGARAPTRTGAPLHPSVVRRTRVDPIPDQTFFCI